MKLQMQKGFTLIELMIVVAIIGILASVALPAYQDYTVRAKMSEVMTVASAGKTAVSEYFQSEGSLPANNSAAGMDASTAINSTYVESVTVNDGIITTAIKGTGIAILDAGTIVLSPFESNGTTALGAGYAGPIVWKCEPSAATLNKYFPSSCRKS